MLLILKPALGEVEAVVVADRVIEQHPEHPQGERGRARSGRGDGLLKFGFGMLPAPYRPSRALDTGDQAAGIWLRPS
jgi:hypothetical protein